MTPVRIECRSWGGPLFSDDLTRAEKRAGAATDGRRILTVDDGPAWYTDDQCSTTVRGDVGQDQLSPAEQIAIAARVRDQVEGALNEDSWCHVLVPEREVEVEWFWMFSEGPRVARRLRGRLMRTADGFENEVSAQLQFPELYETYPGAFTECLGELDWLPTGTGYLLLVTDPHEVLADESGAADGAQLANALRIRVVQPFAAAAAELARTTQDDGEPRDPLTFDVVLLCDDEHVDRVRHLWGQAGAPLGAGG